jgi:hypothetical protein
LGRKWFNQQYLVDDIRDKISQLIRGEDFTFKRETKLALAQLSDLQKILNCEDDIPEQHNDLFSSYVFELGYLSVADNINHYKVSNSEIRSEFANGIIDYYVETRILFSEAVKQAVDALNEFLHNEMTGATSFKKSLNKLF